MGSGRKGRGEGLGGKEGRRTAVRMLKTLIKNIKWMGNLKFVKICQKLGPKAVLSL